ncbi:DNA (cytosine-5-)-methyltransferase [Thioflexithrix psekupsensis]|uniref:Cytosine-specific methyltransferase n=1 Tax=Thioflexithrix psekupsensis TaxID=1570016 RepID=A0A251X6F4_9GAMM|nr:DNA (cytosine-5-)-methyltransferase [Thioflexithrix psekupsensis]OUD13326.1 DNA (cytosine-5-)-methyltransferase [Thioflexithrix psekupsensis]
MKIFKTIDLFAGIGGIRLGFEACGCENVFTSEWDKDAQAMYEANFGEKPLGDITQIIPHNIPDHDILLAGFPCQPFSIIGNRQGFTDTRGTLFFNIEEILRIKMPYAFLLENVKQLRTHDNGRTFKIILSQLKSLGYFVHYTVLNALDFGLPQKRERTIIVGFKENINFSFPKPTGKFISLAEIVEPDCQVDKKYFASEYIIQKRLNHLKSEPFYPSIWHENKGGNISVLPFSCALRAGGSYNYLLVNGKRRPTEREMLRLQGFPENFIINVNYAAMRKLAGNSVAVPVFKAVAKQMIKAMQHPKITQEPEQLSILTPV